ncbi:hypothetical protein I5907_21410 [Panacibacter sp. DH6]|uniref:Uncharacterized protein n=1 Tax=Panacibacter microcysteis TaxID=2793269 RepID=A0A931H0L3_9BACT|nr:hypothetical protein [Panacibacter microcysteis]MBG9378805.1 hypothetical protein [Panacibacter microcysteis]
MLIKIDRQEAINKFPILPLRHYDRKKDEDVFKSPKVFANYVLTVPSKSYKGHQKLLGTQIAYLAKNLGSDHLVFLGDIDIAWLKRLDTYENFQEALQYLVGNKIGKRFNGALKVAISELPSFIKNLSWLVRTNGILPYVHFTDPGQNIVAYICQYGNVHISTRSKTADKRFKDIVSKSQFTYLTDTNCVNKFSKSSAIKGRTITV